MKIQNLVFISLFSLSVFSLNSMTNIQSQTGGVFADPTLTTSQTDVQAVGNFLKDIVDPSLSIPQKIQKYNQGFDQNIKKDTAATEMDKFIIIFNGFVANVVVSPDATIDDLQKLFDLFAKIRDGGKLTPDQQKKLSIGMADSIRTRLDIQKVFRSQIESAAASTDFNFKFTQYKSLFTSSLNENINNENRKLWTDGVGQLTSAVLVRDQKDISDVRSFLNDVLTNKFYENKTKLLSPEIKDRIKSYIQVLDNKINELKGIKPVAKPEPKPEQKPQGTPTKIPAPVQVSGKI
jgi:hypothetical protein